MTSDKEQFWARLDRGVYRIETGVVVGSTAIMTAVVFLAVVWRIFATPKGKMYQLYAYLLGESSSLVEPLADGSALLVWTILVVLAVRTSRKTWDWGRVIAVGSALGLVSVGASLLFVYLLPQGLVFSQRLALALFMWVVLLGSSMAAHTRRHIFLQAAQKLIPEPQLRAHAAIGLFIAAIFTLFLTYVGGVYALANFQVWWSTDFEAGIFESIPIPYWCVTVAIPVGFGLTAIRFLGQGVAILGGHLPPIPPSDEIEAAKQAQQEPES